MISRRFISGGNRGPRTGVPRCSEQRESSIKVGGVRGWKEVSEGDKIGIRGEIMVEKWLAKGWKAAVPVWNRF